MTEINLYFGREIQNGPVTQMVTDDLFMRFLEENVMNIFPSFTIIPSLGVWNKHLEPCTIIQIIVDYYSPHLIKQMCENYCEKFSQTSVLVTYK